jgi:hypothetical protein
MNSRVATPEHHEHVFFTSEDIEEVVPNTFNAELVQPGAGLRLQVFNGTYLTVESRRHHTEYWLNLAFVDPAPERRMNPLAKSFLVAPAMLGGTLLVGAATLGQSWAMSAAAAATLALMAAGFVHYRSCEKLVFRTRHGRMPVLRISRHQPNRKELRAFLGRLERAIGTAVAERSPTRAQYLRDEMREHRRLLSEGILKPHQFEAAKRAILGAHG